MFDTNVIRFRLTTNLLPPNINSKNLELFLSYLHKEFLNHPNWYVSFQDIVDNLHIQSQEIHELGNHCIDKKWAEIDFRYDSGWLKIKITEKGIKKLESFEEIIEKSSTSDKKILSKTTLFFILIGIITASGVVLAYVEYFQNLENNTNLEECVSGEFGLKIVNCELGLEITRPNIKWLKDTDFVSFYIPEEVILNTDSDVIGVMTIGKKGDASLSIRVLEVKQLTDQKFENFANKFYEKLFATYPTYEHSKPFIVGDNAIFEMTGTSDSGSKHIWEYLLEMHNDRIYIFVEDIRIDRSNVQETYSELKQMVDSFTYSK